MIFFLHCLIWTILNLFLDIDPILYFILILDLVWIRQYNRPWKLRITIEFILRWSVHFWLIFASAAWCFRSYCGGINCFCHFIPLVEIHFASYLFILNSFSLSVKLDFTDFHLMPFFLKTLLFSLLINYNLFYQFVFVIIAIQPYLLEHNLFFISLVLFIRFILKHFYCYIANIII